MSILNELPEDELDSSIFSDQVSSVSRQSELLRILEDADEDDLVLEASRGNLRVVWLAMPQKTMTEDGEYCVERLTIVIAKII